MEILHKAAKILEKHPLCSSCLGRQFALLGHGLTNAERGDAIRILLVLEANRAFYEDKIRGIELLNIIANNDFSLRSNQAGTKLKSTENIHTGAHCYLCTDVFESLDTIAHKAIDRIRRYDYSHFLVGIKLAACIVEREDELRARFRIPWGEAIRNDLSREIGKRIGETTGKPVSFKRPDLLITINPFTQTIWVKANSLLIYGRYRKFCRDIPQAKWVCSNCQGKGCEKCQGQGKFYADSIEELIARPLLHATNGSDVKIHAAGREDIDVRVLGLGRPFILEILNPIKRQINLPALQQEINTQAEGKIEVEHLRFTSKEVVKLLKSHSGNNKVYRAIVELQITVADKDLTRLLNIQNVDIRQQTPTRVQHRRASRLRIKKVYHITHNKLKPTIIELMIRCQGGLYIKEFINGDGGRTTPSVAEILSVPAECIELDVVDIDMEGLRIA